MFIVVVDHICKPGLDGQAIARIDRNGQLMAGIAGFVHRFRTRRESDGAICTITLWQSEAAHDDWQAFRASLPQEGGESPYVSVAPAKHRVEGYTTAADVPATE